MKTQINGKLLSTLVSQNSQVKAKVLEIRLKNVKNTLLINTK